ncbi:MAG: alpha/beta hydrolase [Bdellovibrionota bacterium]
MKRIEILSHAIQYKEIGSGSTVILVHGYGGTIYDWDEVAALLAKNYHVVIPNLSSIYMDPLRAVSFSQQVTVFREFINLFKKSAKDTIYIAGGSYGAAICYGVAIEESNLVDRVALLNPMPPHPRDLLKNSAMKLLMEASKLPAAVVLLLKSPAGRLGMKYIQRIFNVPWIKSNAQKNRLEKITTRKAKLIAHVLNRFTWINEVEDWEQWEKRLGYLKTPVHIIWGDKDNLFISGTYERLSEKFPSCEITKVEGGKHVLMKERPEEISRILIKFFSSHEKALKIVYDNQEAN